MEKISFKRIFALSAMIFCAVCGFAKDSDSVAFTKKLGMGYNWGNTLEAMGSGLAGFEISWGAPVSTKEMFEDLKSRGINVVRIPVAWSINMREDNIIDKTVANRVNEVVDYAIDSGLYVILNIHWDGGWINDPKRGFSKNWKACMTKYTSIWNQICERYKDYDEHLIFESLNEEGNWEDVWNRYNPKAGNKKAAYSALNTINQQFVNLVRKSGGNNKNRYLLIAGYATDIDLTCDPLFLMPEDPKNRCMISVHYYTPSNFAILTEDASWGKNRTTWGTQSDLDELKRNLTKMKTTFHDKGIGVIIGEYGCPLKNKEPDSVYKYITEVATQSFDMGMCPILWAGATDIYNRRELKFDEQRFADYFMSMSKKERLK